MAEFNIEACAVCKTVKYGGWAGDWCDCCEDDTESVHIPISEAKPRTTRRVKGL
jgi:hypothetical protein